ncbi:MAG: hypothetical protein ABI780_04695 [Ardenticatenales bacterium]
MPARIDPLMQSLADEDPSVIMDAIISAEGPLDALLERLPKSLTIRHTYHLVPGVAVCGPIGDIQALAELAVVRSIEPVRAVRHS